MMETNTRTVLFATRYEIPIMLGQGDRVIVNMASVFGHVAFAGMGAYGALKHAILVLTKAAALELSRGERAVVAASEALRELVGVRPGYRAGGRP